MLNDLSLNGRLVRDPEVRRTGSGTTVCNFTLAVDRDFKGSDGEKATDFIDCTAWRHNAEFASKYLKKGAMACVKGRMESRKWTDKDGNSRTSWYCNCESVYSLESRREATSEQRQQYTSPGYTAPTTYAPPPAYGGDGYTQGDFAMLDDDDAQLPF